MKQTLHYQGKLEHTQGGFWFQYCITLFAKHKVRNQTLDYRRKINHIQKENLIQEHQIPVYVPCYTGNLRWLPNHFHKSCERDISLVF